MAYNYKYFCPPTVTQVLMIDRNRGNVIPESDMSLTRSNVDSFGFHLHNTSEALWGLVIHILVCIVQLLSKPTVIFCLLFPPVVFSSPSVAVSEALCGIVAATNISSLHSEWSCTANMVVTSNPCGSSNHTGVTDAPWYGVTCALTQDVVVEIALDGLSLAGMFPLRVVLVYVSYFITHA